MKTFSPCRSRFYITSAVMILGDDLSLAVYKGHPKTRTITKRMLRGLRISWTDLHNREDAHVLDKGFIYMRVVFNAYVS